MENTSAYQPTMAVKYKLKLKRNRSSRKARPKNKTKKLPHVTRLLALAHHLQGLVDRGMVTDYADIARLSNLTRSRITQLMNLTLLAPDIQEEILNFPISASVTIKEQDLRSILKTAIWQEQYTIWDEIKANKIS